jgi:GR25 family glycosyltransferase involved in LPS biosynthesis
MIPPSYVITIKDDLGPQEEALNNAGVYPELFRGVNGNQGEHEQYTDKIASYCKKFCPNNVKGATLSHMLVCEHIYKTGAPIALVLEDDAYPIEGVDLDAEIDKVLSEVPEDWEIIRLHGDAFTKKNTNKVEKSPIKLNGSAAAYLVNHKSAYKMSQIKVNGFIDLYQNETFNIYKSKNNLFWTDESASGARSKRPPWLGPIMDTVMPFTNGEKNWSMGLSYNIFYIPWLDIRLSIMSCVNIILCLILVLLFILLKK